MFTRRQAHRRGSDHLDFSVEGLPEQLPADVAALLRSRLFWALEEMVQAHPPPPFALRLSYASPPASPPFAEASASTDNVRTAPGSKPGPTWQAVEPAYRLDQVKLPEATLDRILDSIAVIDVAPKVFDDWNLRAIEPHPSIAINFRGPSGTGKTMAAHAVAHELGRKILLSRLSDLESKYHGDGPKHVASLFKAARLQNAVLFLDEAESLLSRRFAQPEQAAESAINSMRTELMMALDSFEGLVIFASNLPRSYDVAIRSRLLHVDFDLPDRDLREEIWRSHLVPGLPLASDLSISALADVDGVSGRDIKSAIIMAAVGAARRGLETIDQAMLQTALERQRTETEDSGRIHHDGPAGAKLAAAVQSSLAAQPAAGVPPATANGDGSQRVASDA